MALLGPPHVLRAHMGVHCTCGGPNEIELTIRVLTDAFTARCTCMLLHSNCVCGASLYLRVCM